LIYIDSCIFIYFVERHSRFYETVRGAALAASGDDLVISPLVQAECLVSPLRRNDTVLARRFRSLFRRTRSLDLTEAVFLEAAEVRARGGLKLPDALHLACARHHGCTELWTNDHRFGAAGAGIVRALTP
jgi:predicted nucleic acid-binding protein